MSVFRCIPPPQKLTFKNEANPHDCRFILFFGACSKNEAHSERQETESKFSESTDKGADETATKEDLIGGLFDLGSALVKSADEVEQNFFSLLKKNKKT